MNSSIIIVLIIALIPFLTNLYVTKYLHDVKENNKCKSIDSSILTLYYDFYIISAVILGVSILGFLLIIHKNTDIFKIGIVKKLFDVVTKNKKIVDVISVVFSLGLFKLIHDLRKEPECDKIDNDMATNIYYYSIFGVVMGLLELLGVKLY
jgi:hypothetical protein